MSQKSFAEILLDARSHDAAVREPAVAIMQRMEEENLVNYLGSLAQELNDVSKDIHMRTLAATQLKNALTSRNEAKQAAFAQRWLLQDEGLRGSVKQLLLSALSGIDGSTNVDKNLRNATAQVIAIVASIEIPHGQWLEVVAAVISLTRVEGASPGLLESGYTTLGYICEATPGDALRPMSNDILTAIAAGMMPTSPASVVYVATHALTDALPFCDANFDNEQERASIMDLVSGVMASESTDVRVAAWQCLGEIAESYYEYMNTFDDSIMAATMQVLTALLSSVGAAPIEDPEAARVAMMAIEFWTTIASREHSIKDHLDENEGEDLGDDAPVMHTFCGKPYIKEFIGVLLQSLTKQSEDGDDDELTLASAASACFNEICFVTGHEFWDDIINWAGAHVSSPDWHFREAACFALGCITEASNVEAVSSSMEGALDAVFALLRDSVLMVRSSAAWCLRQCAERFPMLFAIPARLHRCLSEVLTSLSDDVKVVKYTSAVIFYLVRTVATSPDPPAPDAAPQELPYGCFSPYFSGLMAKLLEVADASQSPEMHVSCYEAMTQLVEFAADDIMESVFEYLPVFVQRLQASIAAVAGVVPDEDNMSRLEDVANLQALSVSMLQTMLVRMTPEQMAPHADALMRSLFLPILAGPTMATPSTVGEETLTAITSVATEAKSGFLAYMPEFVPLLVRAIEGATNTDLCIAGVRALSAICAALEGMLSIDDMDQLLGALLSSFNAAENVDRRVKLVIVETMVEVKIALGAQFVRYLGPFMEVFVPASQMALPSSHDAEELDAATIDFLVKLQGKFFMTYMAFLTLAYDGAGAELAGSIQPMVDFALAALREPELRMGTLTLAIEFIGDVCRHAVTLHAGMPKMLVDLRIHEQIIDRGLKSGKKKPKKAAVTADGFYKEMCAAAGIIG